MASPHSIRRDDSPLIIHRFPPLSNTLTIKHSEEIIYAEHRTPHEKDRFKG